VQTKVVDVPQFLVDKQGRIHGRGHAVRDIFAWSIPILWPIDLLNLPRRGPRPALRAETKLIVKLMDDLQLPLLPYQQEPAPQPAPYQPPAVLQQRPQPQSYEYPRQQMPFYYSPAIVYERPRTIPVHSRSNTVSGSAIVAWLRGIPSATTIADSSHIGPAMLGCAQCAPAA
jgi:hypothetical protein